MKEDIIAKLAFGDQRFEEYLGEPFETGLSYEVNSGMKTLGEPFEEVNSERLILAFYDYGKFHVYFHVRN